MTDDGAANGGGVSGVPEAESGDRTAWSDWSARRRHAAEDAERSEGPPKGEAEERSDD